MIDSEATELFINKKYIKKLELETKKCPTT